MQLSQAEMNIRNRLLNCRRTHYKIKTNDLIKIRDMIRRSEVSKKTVCKMFHITYDDLKSQLKALNSAGL